MNNMHALQSYLHCVALRYAALRWETHTQTCITERTLQMIYKHTLHTHITYIHTSYCITLHDMVSHITYYVIHIKYHITHKALHLAWYMLQNNTSNYMTIPKYATRALACMHCHMHTWMHACVHALCMHVRMHVCTTLYSIALHHTTSHVITLHYPQETMQILIDVCTVCFGNKLNCD